MSSSFDEMMAGPTFMSDEAARSSVAVAIASPSTCVRVQNDVASNGGDALMPERVAVSSRPVQTCEDKAITSRDIEKLRLNWSAEEQVILERGLRTYRSEQNLLKKYLKIASLLPHKLTRNVAERHRWMKRMEEQATKEERVKMSQQGNRNPKKKRNNNKGKSTAISSTPPKYQLKPIPTSEDIDVLVSTAEIGGPAGDILEENMQRLENTAKALEAIGGGSGELRGDATKLNYKLEETRYQLAGVRDNLQTLLDGLEPLPNMGPIVDFDSREEVKLNLDLADMILPRSSRPVPKSQQ